MTTENWKAEMSRLHAVAVKAAQRLTAATPGTQTKLKLEVAYEKAETAFGKFLNLQ